MMTKTNNIHRNVYTELNWLWLLVLLDVVADFPNTINTLIDWLQ